MNTKTSIRRIRPARPTKKQPVHKTKVVDMTTARGLLRALSRNLIQAIDQETLVEYRQANGVTNVAFVIGTREMIFNLTEGDQS